MQFMSTLKDRVVEVKGLKNEFIEDAVVEVTGLPQEGEKWVKDFNLQPKRTHFTLHGDP